MGAIYTLSGYTCVRFAGSPWSIVKEMTVVKETDIVMETDVPRGSHFPFVWRPVENDTPCRNFSSVSMSMCVCVCVHCVYMYVRVCVCVCVCIVCALCVCGGAWLVLMNVLHFLLGH